MGKILKALAFISVLGFPVAVAIKRLGIADFRVSFSIIQWSLLLAVAVFVVGLVVMFLQRGKRSDLGKGARTAVLLSLFPIIGLGFQIITARSLPMIHNISTDTVNPPQFEELVALRGSDSNPHEYDADELAIAQQKAYPDVQTHYPDLSLRDAYRRAYDVATALGWELVAENPEAGVIEATETTTLWQFKDDIVIRVQEQGDRVAVDLHSVSRVGLSDLGANANRIRRFLQMYQEQ